TVRMGYDAESALLAENTGGRRLRGVVRDAWQPTAGASRNRHRLSLSPGDRVLLRTPLVPRRRGDPRAVRPTGRLPRPPRRAARRPRAGASRNRHRLSLSPGDRVLLRTPLVPRRRGDLRAVGVTVRLRGPLGLAARQRTLDVPGTVRSLPPFESRKHLPSRL